MATTSTAQAPPKKTMFKTLFKVGGGSGEHHKSSTSHSHPVTSSQPTPAATHQTNGNHNAGCTCCQKKFSLRQSFRKSTCHGCQKKVCKKCYLANKLCHKCVIKQRPEVNSTTELLKIDNERLVAILKQVHCDATHIEKYKQDRNAMVRTLLTICELKSTMIEYEKSVSGTLRHDKITPQEFKVKTKQPDNLPSNSTFIDMHRISMPPQTEGDEALNVITHQQVLSVSQEQTTVVLTNGCEHHNHDDSLIVQSPIMKIAAPFSFLPDHVIKEEDENEEAEHVASEYPEEPAFSTPPLTPNSNRKSQIEIFYSTTEIPQMEKRNEISLDVQTKEAGGYVKLMNEVQSTIVEKDKEQLEDVQNEGGNQLGLQFGIQMEEKHYAVDENKFELKLSNLNQAYRPQYKVNLGDLTTTISEEDISQLSLFELKTVLQKRGRPITGLISYDDFVQKVSSVMKEEKSAKEAEQKARKEAEQRAREEAEQRAREEAEEKSRRELEERLEEEMKKMEEERQCLEEAERFRRLYEEEHGVRESDAGEEEESEDEKRKISEEEGEMKYETAEVIQPEVKTANLMKTEVDDFDQIEFEMIENRLQIEEIEEEWKTSAIKYSEIAPSGQPEIIELDDEDSLSSLPSPPSSSPPTA